ncbi:MAG: hypothetical protein SNH01_07400 [Rikenellaceae bacterium]
MDTNNSQKIISEAIRKIALGRSADRVAMSPSGIGGVGTARMIHGYVAKINEDPNDEYCGTIDVGEYPDETASTEPIIHKGVLLAGTQDNSGGFLIIPTLFSDVTIVSDAATRNSYVVNFSHADFIQLRSHKEVVVGVVETDEVDAGDENSPDYNELEATGNEATTKYSPDGLTTTVKNDSDKEATIVMDAESITHTVDKSAIKQTSDKVQQDVNGTTITLADKKVTLGDEMATEPLVLGNELAQLMLEFITECSKIMTPTMIGTMPAINAPNFPSLATKIQNFLSQTSFTK